MIFLQVTQNWKYRTGLPFPPLFDVFFYFFDADHSIQEPSKEEFSDWPHGLLTIGTFGNNDLKENPERQGLQDDDPSLSQELAEFTTEEVGKVQKKLTKLLSRKPASKVEGEIANLPLDRFLNCPSSLEVDRSLEVDLNEEEEEEDIDRTIRVILGRCRDACMESKKKAIGKKSISFLLKKMFVCTRSGFAPAPSLRVALPDSRMEKLLRTMLSKKIYPQNSSRASSMKKYIEEEEEEEDKSNDQGSKWVKTDSEYIVLEI